jgi:multicomponent K+:H+ antiporter subunit E
MSRLLPFPLLSAALLAMWLLLQQSLAPAHRPAGPMLALLGPLALRLLSLPPARVRRPLAIVRLLGLGLDDVIRSNNAVAPIILQPGHPRQVSGFVDIPLTLRDRYGITVLAMIITATPGTLWAGYDPATGVMRLHVLDLIDERAWVNRIQQRYESLLLEIFE